MMQASKSRIDEAIFCYQKAIELNPQSAEAYQYLGRVLARQQQWQQAISYYQKAIELQPNNWEAMHHLGDALLNLEEWEQAANAYRRSIEIQTSSSHLSVSRETPTEIEDCVDLAVSKIRRQLMDSAIVNQFETLLNQTLMNMNDGIKELDFDALIHSLAEIKTDIYYLKTKLSNPSPEAVDPQAKKTINPHQLLGNRQPLPIKCDLRNRIIGKGWHDAETNGRWTGPTTISSVVLPYPCTGKYKLEMLVKAEVIPNLIDTLQVQVNDNLLELSIKKSTSNTDFWAIVQAKITLNNQAYHDFLAIDLIVEKTISPESLGLSDSRFLGLFVEQISLIPQ